MFGDKEPILDKIGKNGVCIGDSFVYDNELWVRTGTYAAKSIKHGVCNFGYIGSNHGNHDPELNDILAKAKPINGEALERLVIDNIDLLVVDEDLDT